MRNTDYNMIKSFHSHTLEFYYQAFSGHFGHDWACPERGKKIHILKTHELFKISFGKNIPLEKIKLYWMTKKQNWMKTFRINPPKRLFEVFSEVLSTLSVQIRIFSKAPHRLY